MDALGEHMTGHLTAKKRRLQKEAPGSRRWKAVFSDRMEQNEEITAKFMSDKDFQDTGTKHLREQVYRQI